MSAAELPATAEFDNKLIELVRANPVLYEKELRSTPYDSVKKKTELWRSIATSLGVETRYCIARWKNLRDKFRCELAKAREIERKSGGTKAKGSAWLLLDKMRFLERHIKHYGLHNTKSAARQTTATWNEMEAEQLAEVRIEDDPLQEAMDEQSSSGDKDKPTQISTPAQPINIKRIETLLEGIDETNRIKAEKRIVAFLCKCQLKSLNSESIDDVSI